MTPRPNVMEFTPFAHAGKMAAPQAARCSGEELLSPYNSGSMSVRIGKLKPERRGEGSHVAPITLYRFVPAVMFDLKLGGQAADGSVE